MPRVEIEFQTDKKNIVTGQSLASIKLDGIEVAYETQGFDLTADVDSALTLTLRQFVTERFRLVAPDPQVIVKAMVPEGFALAVREIKPGTFFYYGVRYKETEESQ